MRGVRSRSPGPACRRRSGRRSRPTKGRVRLRSRAWPGSCRRPCSGARRRCPPIVRGHQVGLAVAVQVADRNRDGRVRLRSRAGAGSCRRPCSGARRRCLASPFAVARSGLPSPFRSPIATDEGASGCVAPRGGERRRRGGKQRGDAEGSADARENDGAGKRAKSDRPASTSESAIHPALYRFAQKLRN